MLTNDGWLETNIRDRSQDHSLDFKCVIHPHQFKSEDFHSACDETAMLLASDPRRRFLALSNGIDSEYVARCLHRNQVEFTPIVAIPTWSRDSFQEPLALCENLGIDPVIIEVDQGTIIKRFYSDIVIKLNGVGINSTYSLIAADYARQCGGSLITGDHMLGDDSRSVQMIEGAEWDFYLDALMPDLPYVPFFGYRLETIYAMSREMDGTSADDFRYRLYDIDFRPKFKYKYDQRYDTIFDAIRRSRKHRPSPVHVIGDRNQFIRYLDKWRII
jgi:hypothetical protein